MTLLPEHMEILTNVHPMLCSLEQFSILFVEQHAILLLGRIPGFDVKINTLIKMHLLPL